MESERIGSTAVRAFLTAHLLTADAGRAEKAALAGIESWKPDCEGADALFQKVLEAAALAPGRDALCSGGIQPPDELQRVMQLPPQLRRSFVLRVLLGLPPYVCGPLLQLKTRRVSHSAYAAIIALRWKAHSRSEKRT